MPVLITALTAGHELRHHIAGSVGRAHKSTCPTATLDGVRLALFVVNPLCPERWLLESFWRETAQEEDGGEGIGRRQGLSAVFNGLLHQLGRPTE